MASSNSDYETGSMPIEAQAHTFGGFMNFTVYGGSLVAFILLYPILVFCTPLAWLPSLIITFVFGVVLGLALKLKGGWYAGIVGVSIFLAIATLLLTLFRSAVG